MALKEGSVHPHSSSKSFPISAAAALGANAEQDPIPNQGAPFIPPLLSGPADKKGTAPRAQLTAPGGGPPQRWGPPTASPWGGVPDPGLFPPEPQPAGLGDSWWKRAPSALFPPEQLSGLGGERSPWSPCRARPCRSPWFSTTAATATHLNRSHKGAPYMEMERRPQPCAHTRTSGTQLIFPLVTLNVTRGEIAASFGGGVT